MDAYNIAICLAPTLIPVPEDKKDQVNHQTDTIELIKLIIQHNDEIFNIECDGPVYEKFDRYWHQIKNSILDFKYKSYINFQILSKIISLNSSLNNFYSICSEMDNDEENLDESEDDEEDESEKQYLRNISDDGKYPRASLIIYSSLLVVLFSSC